MQYLIDQYGFWGYMQHFLIDPITIAGAVVIAGIIVILITAAARKKKVTAMSESTFNLTDNELSECRKILEQTKRPFLKLKAVRGATSVFDSKFGGVPYLPRGFEYPRNERKGGGKPLKLLCQLNFAQLPALPVFPTTGILQFYVTFEDDEDIFGLDFDAPTKQESWRVVYHETVAADETLVQTPPEFSDKNPYFPFEGEFALKFELSDMPVNNNDFGWDDFWKGTFEASEIYKKLRKRADDDTIQYDLSDAIYSTGHRIGGYPFFTQADPRGYGDKYREHTILLLQIDSEDEIMWGDCGVANFFITPEALEKRDFSNVLYNWDCG